MRATRRRRGERGNMVVIVALFGTVLIGSMAVATDLSVSTHFKRHLQNVTDAAALAGAKQLPAVPATSDQENATVAALELVHNSYPWTTPGGSWASTLAQSGCNTGQCHVTICANLTLPNTTCTVNRSPGSNYPFVLTINTPPLDASVARYNGDVHRVEVLMTQQSSAFFAGVFGSTSNQDGAESIGYHYAPGQPFPFALFSRTIVQSGNDGESIAGNIYADRYVEPQSNGHAGICAAPDSSGTPGYIFLGYPQQDDGGAYQNDGQTTTNNADPILDGVTCPTAGGVAGMSANPGSASGCVTGYTGSNGSASITFDSQDGACEVNPAVQPPNVAPPPNIPSYATTVCGSAGLSGGSYQPNEYACSSGAALNVDHTLAPGIYEIDPGARTGGCDVTMDGTITSLPDVTFYLKGGAGICITVASGVTINQTPYDGGTGDPGDGRYIALSDNVGNPSITLTSSGGGSTSGVWSVVGTIWLPTGSVTINNKTALEDTGQIVANTWNDQSGYHLNPAVTYNGTFAPPQNEVLELTE